MQRFTGEKTRAALGIVLLADADGFGGQHLASALHHLGRVAVADGLRLEDVPVGDDELALPQAFHQMAGNEVAGAI